MRDICWYCGGKLFWVLWGMVIAVVVFGFYYLDNNWLNA